MYIHHCPQGHRPLDPVPVMEVYHALVHAKVICPPTGALGPAESLQQVQRLLPPQWLV